MVRLIPKETQFFDMFEEIVNNVMQGATILRDLLLNYQQGQAQPAANRIKELERRGDAVGSVVKAVQKVECERH